MCIWICTYVYMCVYAGAQARGHLHMYEELHSMCFLSLAIQTVVGFLGGGGGQAQSISLYMVLCFTNTGGKSEHD